MADISGVPTAASSRERDRCLCESIEAISAGLVSGLGELFDEIGGAVWYVSLLVSDDREMAAQATIRTFGAAWRSPGAIPRDPRAARGWILSTACRVSRELAGSDGTSHLRLVVEDEIQARVTP